MAVNAPPPPPPPPPPRGRGGVYRPKQHVLTIILPVTCRLSLVTKSSLASGSRAYENKHPLYSCIMKIMDATVPTANLKMNCLKYMCQKFSLCCAHLFMQLDPLYSQIIAMHNYGCGHRHTPLLSQAMQPDFPLNRPWPSTWPSPWKPARLPQGPQCC